MTWRVEISPSARSDLRDLIEFLEPRSPVASDRARETLSAALVSLSDFPHRGRQVGPGGVDLRELPVRFGRYGYAIRYRILEDLVLVTRIRHVREAG